MPAPQNPFDVPPPHQFVGGGMVYDSWVVQAGQIPTDLLNAQAMMAELDLDHAELKMKIEMAKAKQKKEVYQSEYPVTLTYPLIPELNPDGTKALWKTRYDRLEHHYGKLHQDFKNFENGYWEQVNKAQDLMEAVVKLDKEVRVLKSNNVDSEVVQKRMEQVCKELGISMPVNRGQSLETRLNAFFGAIWVRLRAEVVDDQLAE